MACTTGRRPTTEDCDTPVGRTRSSIVGDRGRRAQRPRHARPSPEDHEPPAGGVPRHDACFESTLPERPTGDGRRASAPIADRTLVRVAPATAVHQALRPLATARHPVGGLALHPARDAAQALDFAAVREFGAVDRAPFRFTRAGSFVSRPLAVLGHRGAFRPSNVGAGVRAAVRDARRTDAALRLLRRRGRRAVRQFLGPAVTHGVFLLEDEDVPARDRGREEEDGERRKASREHAPPPTAPRSEVRCRQGAHGSRSYAGAPIPAREAGAPASARWSTLAFCPSIG